jgi:signal-transduction protein with cAMP-binding, CBS, and nucleotidyltransferase domain
MTPTCSLNGEEGEKMVRPFRSSAREFEVRMGRLFETDQNCSCRLEIARDSGIYESGEPGATIYFIRKGRVELLLPGASGPDFPLSSRLEGEIFGETCLSGRLTRQENAVASEDSILQEIPASDFLTGLREHGLLEDLVRYLTTRLTEECQIIESFAMRGNECQRADASPSRGVVRSPLLRGEESA